MLSKTDIEKELGKGLCIFPLHYENIKENSINMTIGQNAWAMKSGEIIREDSGKYKIKKNPTRDVIKIEKGKSAIVREKNKSFLVLLPLSTTIVETSEVIALSNYLGGTVHSKVGIVAKGVGDTGTMLGPCYAGHLMIALHNSTDEVIALRVGTTFISLVFDYLNTPISKRKNSNVSGHVDKLSELGIIIDEETSQFLSADWKKEFEGVKEKMINANAYQDFVRQRRKQKKEWMKYINVPNAIVLMVTLMILLALGIITHRIDLANGNDVWSDRYWTVIITAIIVPMITSSLHKLLKKNE